MSDVVVDAPVSSVDLIGRRVVVADQRVTEIVSTRGEALFTADDPWQQVEGSEVVVLPVLGEFLRTWNGSREVSGHWLGLTREQDVVEGRLAALVMEGSHVQRVTFEPGNVDARRVVTGRAGEGERTAMSAVLAEALAHEQTKQAQQDRIARLVEAAHAEADRRDWCSDFDAFMEAAGLPRRNRDYLLQVEVTATVYVTRAGVSEDDAIGSLTTQDVLDLIGADQISFEAEAA